MKKILGFLSCLLMTAPLYAKNIEYIGTRSNPIPLVSSGPTHELKSITIFLYQDKSFDIKDHDIVLFTGTYSDDDGSIEFSDDVAFANKIYMTNNDDKKTCLQTVMYKPEIYKFKGDWFCPY